MVKQKQGINPTAIGVIILLLTLIGFFMTWAAKRPLGINELWRLRYENKIQDGETVFVSGELLFQPESDFRFNAIYLVDTGTPNEQRIPEDGFWFGLRLADVSCIQDTDPSRFTCVPFDPVQAKSYQFKGTIHFEAVGKKEVMWLANIDFDRSRRRIDGTWRDIPLGKFNIRIDKE
jgi:hypothetical protein